MSNYKDLITKEYGDGIIVSGNCIIDKKKAIIPISPSFNLSLNGGIQEGSFITLTGVEKCGKTITALYIAKKCQEKENGNRKVFYYNIEGRINQKTILGIKGLNLDNFNIIESIPGKILSAEEILDIAIKLISLEENSVHIIDSFSNLCLSAEMSATMGENIQMGGSSRLLSRFCRKISNILPVNNSIIIGITHLIANLSYGAPTQEGGGKAIKYQSDTKLHCKKFEYFNSPASSDNTVGIKVDWNVVHSSLGFPNKKMTSYIRFGEGIDEIFETVNIANDLGLIEQKKAGWFVLSFLSEKYKEDEIPRCQGLEKCKNFLEENQEYKEILYNKINSMVGLKICH